MKRATSTVWIMLALGVLGVTGVRAEDPADEPADDPYYELRGIDDRLGLMFGGYLARFSSDARIGSAEGLGASLQFESLLGFKPQDQFFRFAGYYRFSRRHRIDFRYFAVSRSGSRSVSEPFSIGPIDFEIGASLASSQRTDFIRVGYRYSLVNNGKFEAGIGVGLSYFLIDIDITGRIGIVPGPQATYTVSESEGVPLPVIVLSGEYAIVPRVFAFVESQLFTLEYGRYRGTNQSATLGILGYPTKHFGVGLAYNRERLNVIIEREDDDGDLAVDYEFDGPYFFVSFVFD